MADPFDPFGAKKLAKQQKSALDQQAAEAADVKQDELQERVSRATNQLFRQFGRSAALGGGSGRAGILG